MIVNKNSVLLSSKEYLKSFGPLSLLFPPQWVVDFRLFKPEALLAQAYTVYWLVTTGR